jgi:hypothetical protein
LFVSPLSAIIVSNDSGGADMKRRNQINVTMEDSEFSDINEYCRVYRMTPQSLLKAGAKKLIEEDMLERKADLQTIQSWQEINNGCSEPIDDLVAMIEADRQGCSEFVVAEK